MPQTMQASRKQGPGRNHISLVLSCRLSGNLHNIYFSLLVSWERFGECSANAIKWRNKLEFFKINFCCQIGLKQDEHLKWKCLPSGPG